MKIYKSVKNGTLAKLIDLNDRGVTFEMEDGSQKEFSMSTFKRWWKFDSETPDEIEKASEEQGEPENEVVENEPQEDAPVDNNVDSVDNPPAEKEAPVKESTSKVGKLTEDVVGLLDFIGEAVKNAGLVSTQSENNPCILYCHTYKVGYGFTVKKDDARFTKVNFKYYPRRKYVKVRVPVAVLEEVGITGNLIENDPDNAYIHLSENSEMSQSIITAIVNSTL